LVTSVYWLASSGSETNASGSSKLIVSDHQHWYWYSLL